MNLAACTGVLYPPDGSTFGEAAYLMETASVLELLFSFIYPRTYPDLESLEFDVLEALAEAAEKYQVYFAMQHCKLAMQCVHFYNILITCDSIQILQRLQIQSPSFSFRLCNKTRLSGSHVGSSSASAERAVGKHCEQHSGRLYSSLGTTLFPFNPKFLHVKSSSSRPAIKIAGPRLRATPSVSIYQCCGHLMGI
jgi:hypothetical protein